MKSGVITGNALSTVVSRLATFEGNDQESSLKLIQFTTSIAQSNLFEIPILRSILSLVLSFSTSEDKLIADLSSAAAGQIICELLDLTEKDSSFINDLQLESCDDSIQFKTPLFKIIYFILRDLVNIACGQSAVWLRLPSLTTNVSYGLIETILNKHSHLFNLSPYFQELVGDTAQSAFKQNAPLSFCVKCATVFVESLPITPIAIFADFLTDLQWESPKLFHSLVFFRVFLLQKGNVIIPFCLNCDRNGRLVGELIGSLRAIVEHSGDCQINLSITPRTVDYTISDPIATSVEIVIFFVQACYQAQNLALKSLVLRVWSDILNIFTLTASIVSGKSCYILLQGMHSLVVLAHELALDDARGSTISAFCNVLVTPNGPDAAEVKQIAYETATTAIDTAPAAFTGHWSKLMNAMALFEWHPSSSDWSSSLPISNITEVLHSLLSIVEGQEWALSNVIQILLANSSRFEKLKWNLVGGRFG
jgi:hypothetical protein